VYATTGFIIHGMPIRVLPVNVASQIAAGEVVERPASVVKELVENAIDAGAAFISIKTEGAGKRLIEVSDDGSGIPADELSAAVARHATSKLSTADDLLHITTLGFRGEALASIGSVSQLSITSRPRDMQAGAQLRVDGGMVGRVETAGAPQGTIIHVENLFYNVPARLKFLKSDVTEKGQIDNLVTRYALAYPHVRFHLTQEGKAVLQTSGNGNRREVLGKLYGIETAQKMLEVLANFDEFSVTGYISPTSLTRSNRREITFFVNGRPIQDVSLSTALIQAYHNLLMVGRYPLAVLFIEMPPEALDVNVHPAKTEVRFREREKVFSVIQRAVRRALLAHTPVPGVDVSADFPTYWRQSDKSSREIDLSWNFPQEAGEIGSGNSEMHTEIGTGDEPGSQPPVEMTAQSQASLPGGGVPLLRLVGQFGSKFLVAEGPDGIYLIDQHAAHERVLFEQFLEQRNSPIASQKLLHPVPVDLPPASARLLEEQLPILSRFGFEVELFGPGTYLVRAVPAMLSKIDPSAALRVLVEDFEEDETPLQAEIEARIIARVCKRAAVKAGQPLTPEEQQALISGLESCRSPRTCPHGRPTMIYLSVDLLERQFGRRGAR